MPTDVTDPEPHNEDAEKATLSAMMLSPAALLLGLEKVQPAWYYVASHRFIFLALAKLAEKNAPVDQTTLTAELKGQGTFDQVGYIYLAEVAGYMATSTSLTHYAEIVHQNATRRSYIALGRELIKNSGDYTNPVSSLTVGMNAALTEQAASTPSEFLSVAGLVEGIAGDIVDASMRDNFLVGLSTGLSTLDARSSGLQRGNYYILAARPSVGKTSLALGIAHHVASAYTDEGAVAIVSLEMSREDLIYRMISSKLSIEFNRLRLGRLTDVEWPALNRAVAEIIKLPLYIDDAGGQTITQVQLRLRRLHQKTPLSLVVIDYLQLMSGEAKGGREQEVSTISRGIKAMAKELDVPVLALSQLSRASEMRQGDKRPQLSDLRDSGSLEQDADAVWFLHNPSRSGDEKADPNMVEVLIAKNRNGPTGDFELGWEQAYTRFTDYSRMDLQRSREIYEAHKKMG